MPRFIASVGALLTILVVGLPVTTTVRAKDFDTTLHSTYRIDDSGLASVVHEFAITNTVSTVYSTQYAFEAAGNRISDVKVMSGGKRLPATTSAQANKTLISITFPDKVVGRQQARRFSVEYTTPDVATKTGQILEVSIPRLADASLYTSYSVTLKVSSSYGAPTTAQPNVFTTSHEDGNQIVSFTTFGDHTGVHAIFGKQQYALVDLTYTLENTSTTRGILPVTFPADGKHQKVYYQQIEPRPVTMEPDADGNWIGTYKLDPNQRQTIRATLAVALQHTPYAHAILLGQKPGAEYLSAQEYWQSGSASLRKLARQYRTPRDIYAYVTGQLRYNFTTAPPNLRRLGAEGALQNPTEAVCTEFTDLFIAMARSAGIPARAVIGYAYSDNQSLRPVGVADDILHTWPEYWDETTGSWKAVDPTWEQTTGGIDYFHSIDFNRIVFAIQGKSSTAPLAAGMYPASDPDKKDVLVKYTEAIPDSPLTFESTLQIHPRALLGLSDTYAIQIRNTSLQASYATPVHIRVENAAGVRERQDKIDLIPLQVREIPVQLPRKGIFSQGSSRIKVTINGQQFTHELTLKTTIQQLLPLIVITLLVAGGIGICLYIARRLLVPRWQR